MMAVPIRSALYRAITRANPTAYWPLEDDDGALSAASAVANVDAMQPFGFSRFTAPGTGVPVAAAGLPKFGSGASIPGSAPVVDLAQGGVLAGVVPAGSGSGWRLEFVMVAPRDKAAARIPIRWTTNGTFPAWELQIESTGLFATFRTSVGAGSSGSATATFNVFDGRPHHYQIEAFQSGSNVDARIYVDDLVVAVFGGTLTGSPGSVRAVTVNPGEEVNGTESMPTFGHLAAWNQPYSGLTTSAVAMTGHTGEPATDRLARLCAEEGVSLSMPSVPAEASSRMGPQRMLAFLDLLRECAEADVGVLHERGFGLGYLPRDARYNRRVSLTLDFDAGQIAEPPEPIDDDQGLVNRVTARRVDGSSAVVEDTASIAAVGTYEKSVDVNVVDDEQLANHAAWRVHLGTVAEMTPSQLRWLAHHEAAHAVTAVALGVEVDWSDLHWRPGTGGTLVRAVDPHTDSVIFLAGWMGSGGHLWGPRSTHDTQEAIELVGMAGIPAAMRDAEAILASRRSDRAAVAAALLQHGKLTGEQIVALVREPGQPRPGGPPAPTGPAGPRPKDWARSLGPPVTVGQ